MSRLSKLQIGFGKLEACLLLAVAALVFQLFPSLWSVVWSALDIRTWSRTLWFALNAFVLVGLVAARFGPELYADWQERRKRGGKSRRHVASRVNESHSDADYEARVRRDADWRERAKKRLPWHS